MRLGSVTTTQEKRQRRVVRWQQVLHVLNHGVPEINLHLYQSCASFQLQVCSGRARSAHPTTWRHIAEKSERERERERENGACFPLTPLNPPIARLLFRHWTPCYVYVCERLRQSERERHKTACYTRERPCPTLCQHSNKTNTNLSRKKKTNARIVISFKEPIGVIKMVVVNIFEAFLRLAPQVGVRIVDGQGDRRQQRVYSLTTASFDYLFNSSF